MDTGKIKRVVDIAEAPWRVIGLVVSPLIMLVQSVGALVGEQTDADGADAAAPAASADALTPPDAAPPPAIDTTREYGMLLGAVLADDVVDPREREMLSAYAAENGVSDVQHRELLAAAGWSEAEFREGVRRPTPE